MSWFLWGGPIFCGVVGYVCSRCGRMRAGNSGVVVIEATYCVLRKRILEV